MREDGWTFDPFCVLGARADYDRQEVIEIQKDVTSPYRRVDSSSAGRTSVCQYCRLLLGTVAADIFSIIFMDILVLFL